MANDTQKSNNNHRIYIAIAVILLFAIINFSMRSCGNGANIEQIHKSTDTTVDAVEAEHATAGRELDTVGAELNSAKTAISRADELVERSQERITENAASIDECQRIVGECRKIVTDSNRIYREVEEANRSRAGSGSGS